MPELRRALPGVKLHIYGSNAGESVLKLAADDVIVEGYVERVEDVYNRHRVFIAPLRSGAGLKGKVVGALAAGAPTVMTSLAAEGMGVSRGAEAIVVDTPDDWVEAIVVALQRRGAMDADVGAGAGLRARELSRSRAASKPCGRRWRRRGCT